MVIASKASAIALFCGLTLFTAAAAASFHRSHMVEFSNDSDDQVVVDWENPKTGERVEFFRLRNGDRAPIKSYANHTFVLHFLNESCSTDNVCRTTVVKVNDHEGQVVKIKKGLDVELRDSTTKSQFEASDIVEHCHKIAMAQIAGGRDPNVVMTNMLACVEDETANTLEKLSDEATFEESVLKDISAKTENYTCADKNAETTEAKEFRSWTHHNVTRRIHILHERQDSKIHMLPNFISKEECDAIQQAAAPILHRGTVADGKGGHKLSEHRKAQQAGISIPWQLEEQGNPIARVVRRLYDYANHATGYNMDVVGQEDLMSIQYFGRGEADKAPDRYMPHCDGDCSGLKHKRGGRVATMVMYCDAPERGGGTNFQNSGVYVKPTVGAAAFFAYLDPETHIHETGFTTHSGCPVIEGTKRIAVQWMRIGVDKENPWDSFDTLNVKKGECDDD